MKGCSGWIKQPLSTLSASIEHPLGEGENLVEKREGKSQKSYFFERILQINLHISEKSSTFALAKVLNDHHPISGTEKKEKTSAKCCAKLEK